MALLGVVWVIDTSSIIAVRRDVTVAVRKNAFAKLTQLVNNGRLVFPPEVLDELERNTDPKNPDEQYQWCNDNAAKAYALESCDHDDVKAVLADVPTVLDPEKESGVEEADPYVLALAQKLRAAGVDARVVTQESKDTPLKMSMSTAAGVLGIPCVPLKAFLAAEKIPIA
jgi:hypothetical protein